MTDRPGFKVPLCRCGHAPGDHGHAGRVPPPQTPYTEGQQYGPCRACGCVQFVYADVAPDPPSERCDCVPRGNPSVIGACACPVHGLRAVMDERDRYCDALEQIALIARGQVTQYAAARLQVAAIAQEALSVAQEAPAAAPAVPVTRREDFLPADATDDDTTDLCF